MSKKQLYVPKYFCAQNPLISESCLNKNMGCNFNNKAKTT